MRWQLVLMIAVGSPCLLGCGMGRSASEYPPDPLLLSKPPVTAKSPDFTAREMLLAHHEPTAPENLGAVLALRDREPPRSDPRIIMMPASRIHTRSPAPARPVSRAAR